MFIGHFALGFAAKRTVPRLSLATLFAAAQLADIIWPFLVAAGVEQVRIQPGITAFTPLDFVSYPYSHSLLMLCVWGAFFGAACAMATRAPRAFAVVAALVVSHWILDWVTHRPDMPLYPGGPKYGLGLWNSVPGTVTVEVLIFAAGIWMYALATDARDRIGRLGFSAFVGFLLVIYLVNTIGPPPPNVTAIVVAGIPGAALIILWAWWFDRHRIAVGR